MSDLTKAHIVRNCLKLLNRREVNTGNDRDMPLIVERENGAEKIVEYNPFVNGNQLIELITYFKMTVRQYDGTKWVAQHPGYPSLATYSTDFRYVTLSCLDGVWKHMERVRMEREPAAATTGRGMY